MKIKRILIFALLLVSSALLVACGNGKTNKVGPAVINDTSGSNIVHRLGSAFNPKAGITATDAVKGDVTENITVEGTVNINLVGTYNLTYKITGSDGVEFEYKKKVEVKAVTFSGVQNRQVIFTEAVGATFDPETGVSVNDPILGTLYPYREEHKQYFTITGEVNRGVEGDYQLVYEFKVADIEITHTRIISVVKSVVINVPDIENERYQYGYAFNPLLGVTAYAPVEVEKLLQAVDENGEPMVDEAGKPIYVQAKDENGELLFDEDGNPIYEVEKDENGNPIITYGSIEVTEHIEVSGSVNPRELGEYELVYRIKDPDNPLEYLKDPNGQVVIVRRYVEIYNLVEIRGVAPAQTQLGDDFDLMAGITGHDSILGIITNDIQIIGEVNKNVLGAYLIVYILTGSNGVTAQVERTVTVVPPVEGKQQIVIMTGDLKESNPFHPDFSGTNARQRQEAQTAAEEKHDVEVIYKAYPDNAAWGPDRVNAIVQASTAGEPLADIFYHVTTDWLGQLAGGGALAAIDNYITEGKPGAIINQSYIDAGAMGGRHYAFSTGALNLSSGLYFNINLLNQLGIPNPTELYLGAAYAADKAAGLLPEERSTADAGKNWRWSDFKAWAVNAKNSLASVSTSEDMYYALGGALAYYGENMVPLNGGGFLDLLNGEVIFAKEEALATYDFINSLYLENLFEPSRGYDQGSAEWQAGKVLMHPGDLWFIKADNRWGALGFDFGFVPYPMADDYDGEYKSPVYGASVAYLAAGHTAAKNELAFNVWVDLQLWEHSEFTPEEAYRISLEDKFNDDIYIDAYMTVYDKTYVEFLNSIGVGAYTTNSLKSKLNAGIRDSDYRTQVTSVVETYKYYLDLFMQGN